MQLKKNVTTVTQQQSLEFILNDTEGLQLSTKILQQSPLTNHICSGHSVSGLCSSSNHMC